MTGWVGKKKDLREGYSLNEQGGGREGGLSKKLPENNDFA